MSPLDVLRAIAANGAAMSMLDSPAGAIEAGRPPKVDRAGRLLIDADGDAVEPGRPHRTLGDLVREALKADEPRALPAGNGVLDAEVVDDDG